MQVKTILNRIEKHPSFVYETVGLVDGPRLRLEVKVRASGAGLRHVGGAPFPVRATMVLKTALGKRPNLHMVTDGVHFCHRGFFADPRNRNGGGEEWT